ncbi:hypothetical protein GPJ56_004854 [Histomonas meleagridis]|nr:hypothetical protein GPJ56_004854 [Histomonas meleagridis]
MALSCSLGKAEVALRLTLAHRLNTLAIDQTPPSHTGRPIRALHSFSSRLHQTCELLRKGISFKLLNHFDGYILSQSLDKTIAKSYDTEYLITANMFPD